MVYSTSTQQALDRLAELSAKREGADSPIQQGLERLQEAKAKTYSPIQSVAQLKQIREQLGNPLRPEELEDPGFWGSFWGPDADWSMGSMEDVAKAAPVLGPLATNMLLPEPIRKKIPFLGAAEEMIEDISIWWTAKRVDDGTGTEEDERALLEWVGKRQLESLRERGQAADVGAIIGESIPFVGEFILSAGLFTGTKKLATKHVRKKLFGAIDKASSKLARKQAYRASVATGALAGVAAQATVASSPRTVGGAAKLMMPELGLTEDEQGEIDAVIAGEGTPLGQALVRSWADQVIEYGSERTGWMLGKMFTKPMNMVFGKGKADAALKATIAKLWLGLDKTRPVQGLKKAVDKAGWHGIAGEMFEERVGAALRMPIEHMTGDEIIWELGKVAERIGFTQDQLLTEFYAFGLFQNAIAAGVGSVGAVEKIRDLREESKLGKEILEAVAVGEETAKAREEVKGVLGDTVEEGDVTQPGKRVVVRDKNGNVIYEVPVSDEAQASQVLETLGELSSEREYETSIEEQPATILILNEKGEVEEAIDATQEEYDQELEKAQERAAKKEGWTVETLNELAQQLAAEAEKDTVEEEPVEVDETVTLQKIEREEKERTGSETVKVEVVPDAERSSIVRRVQASLSGRGIKVVPIRSTEGELQTPGAYFNGTVYIADVGNLKGAAKRKATRDMFMGVLTHELVHNMEKENPELYRWLVSRAPRLLGRGALKYMSAAGGLDLKGMLSEGGAQMMQDLIMKIGGGKILSRIDTERTMVERFLDWLRYHATRLGLRGQALKDIQELVEEYVSGKAVADIKVEGKRAEQLAKAKERGLVPESGVAPLTAQEESDVQFAFNNPFDVRNETSIPRRATIEKNTQGYSQHTFQASDGRYFEITLQHTYNPAFGVEEPILVTSVDFIEKYDATGRVSNTRAMISGTNKETARIFATVIDTASSIIEKLDSNAVLFGGRKGLGKPKEAKLDSRIKLYDALVKRYANKLGYQAQKEDAGTDFGYIIYKPGLLNNLAGEKLVEAQPQFAASPKEVASKIDARADRKRDLFNDTDYQELVERGAKEINEALDGKSELGRGWYTRDFRRALYLGSLIEPSIKASKKNVKLFVALLAVTSPNQKLALNYKLAVRAFQHYSKTGTVGHSREHNVKPGGAAGPNIFNSLKQLNLMVQDMGIDAATNWLFTKHVGYELAEMRKKYGVYKGGNAALTKEHYGIRIFGGKVGPFGLNFAGVAEEVTVDVWASRSVARWLGVLGTESKYFTIGETGIVENVKNEGVRNKSKQLFRDIGERVGLEPQDAQAVLWYYEKRLYANEGYAAAGADTNLESSAKQLVQQDIGDRYEEGKIETDFKRAIRLADAATLRRQQEPSGRLRERDTSEPQFAAGTQRETTTEDPRGLGRAAAVALRILSPDELERSQDLQFAAAPEKGSAEEARIFDGAYKGGVRVSHGTVAKQIFWDFSVDYELGAHFGTPLASEERLEYLTNEPDYDIKNDKYLRVYDVRLNIKKPFKMNDAGVWTDVESLVSNLKEGTAYVENGLPGADFNYGPYESMKKFKEFLYETRSDAVLEASPTLNVRSLTEEEAEKGRRAGASAVGSAARDFLELNGFDSIVYSNNYEDAGSESYIVFNSENIFVENVRRYKMQGGDLLEKGEIIEYGTQPQFAAASPVGTQEFNSFFSGSKMVDSNGNPIVFYHGSKATFNDFDIDKASVVDPDVYVVGFHFSSRLKTAELFLPTRQEGIGGTLRRVILSIKKPANIKDVRNAYKRVEEKANKTGLVLVENVNLNRLITEELKSMGFDGYVVEWKKPLDESVKKEVDKKGKVTLKNPDGSVSILTGPTVLTEFGTTYSLYQLNGVSDSWETLAEQNNEKHVVAFDNRQIREVAPETTAQPQFAAAPLPDNLEARRIEIDGVKYDANVDTGIGAHGNNQNIAYRGFALTMSPLDFKTLTHILEKPKERSFPYLKSAIKSGKPIGQPTLYAKWDDVAKVWKVNGHEGRHRSLAIDSVKPGARVLVHVIPRGEIRARDITDEMKSAPFISERGGLPYEINKTQIREATPETTAQPQFAAPHKKRVKTTVREATGQVKDKITIDELKAQRIRYKAEKRAATKAAADVKRTERQLAQERLEDFKLKQKAREGEIEERKDALKIVIGELPSAVRKELPPTIQQLDIKSELDLDKAIEKIDEALAKFETKQSQNKLKKVIKNLNPKRFRPEFWKKIQEIVGDLDMSKPTAKTVEGMLKLKNFLTKISDPKSKHYDPDLAAELEMYNLVHGLDRLTKKPIANMTKEEADAAIAAIQLLEQLNRLKQQLVTHNRRVNRAQRIATVLREMKAAQGRYTARRKETGERKGELKSESRSMVRALSSFFGLSRARILQPDAMADLLSGGANTTMWDTLYGDIDRAYSDFLSDYYDSVDYITGVLKDLGVDTSTKKGMRMMVEMSRPLASVKGRFFAAKADGSIGKPELVKAKFITFKAPTSGTEIELTEGELIDVLAHFYDADTVKQMLGGAPVKIVGLNKEVQLTAKDIIELKRWAEENHQRAVQIADAMVSYANGPLAQLMERWSVDKHGYSNVSENTWWSRPREHSKQEQEALEKQGMVRRSLSSAGVTKGRVEKSKDPILIQDAFVKFSNLAWTISGVSNMENAVSTAKAVLNDKKVKEFISETKHSSDIKSYYNDLFGELVESIVGGVPIVGSVDRWGRRLRNNFVKGTLALNPRVGAYQFVSVAAATAEIPHLHVAEASGAMGLNVAGSMAHTVRGSNKSEISRIDNAMDTWSPYLRLRFDSSAFGLVTSRSGMEAVALFGVPPKGEKGMMLIQGMDRMAIRTLWRSSELWVSADIKDGKLDMVEGSDAYWSEVARRTETAVKRTQPTMDPLHSSGLTKEAKRSFWASLLTMFMSQRNKNANMIARALLKSRRGELSPRSVKPLVSTLMYQPLGLIVIAAAYEWALTGDDEAFEKALKGLPQSFLNINLGNVPIGDYLAKGIKEVGQEFGLLDEKYSGFDPSLPVLSTLDALHMNTVALFKNLVPVFTEDEVEKDKLIKAAFNTLINYGRLSGYQVTPVVSQLKRMYLGRFGADDYVKEFNSMRRELKGIELQDRTKEDNRNLARLNAYFESMSGIRSDLRKLKDAKTDKAKETIERLLKKQNDIAKKAIEQIRGK